MGVKKDAAYVVEKAAGIVVGALWLAALGAHLAAETMLDRAMRARVAVRARSELRGAQ